MRLHIKCKHYTSRGEQMELMVNIEDMFAMLDELKPSVLASYLCQRMKPQVCQSSLLLNIIPEEDEGTMNTSSVQEVPSTSSGTGEEEGGAL